MATASGDEKEKVILSWKTRVASTTFPLGTSEYKSVCLYLRSQKEGYSNDPQMVLELDTIEAQIITKQAQGIRMKPLIDLQKKIATLNAQQPLDEELVLTFFEEFIGVMKPYFEAKDIEMVAQL
jgi:hypothetical protein